MLSICILSSAQFKEPVQFYPEEVAAYRKDKFVFDDAQVMRLNFLANLRKQTIKILLI